MCKNLFKCCAISILLLTSNLYSEEPFDEHYAAQVKQGCIYQSSFIEDDKEFWQILTQIEFDNGLVVKCINTYEDESEAILAAQSRPTFGRVNILVSREPDSLETTFLVAYENGEHFAPDDIFYVGVSHLRIMSVTEKVETIFHWFKKNEYIYGYVIKLDDDSLWITSLRSKAWPLPWKEGDRIVKVGNSRHPYLWNVNAQWRQEEKYIIEIEAI